MTPYTESHRGFDIEVTIQEEPTHWLFNVRVGKRNEETFVIEPAIQPEVHRVHKTEGAMNVALGLVTEAKVKIEALNAAPVI